jgi:hypothetical protein
MHSVTSSGKTLIIEVDGNVFQHCDNFPDKNLEISYYYCEEHDGTVLIHYYYNSMRCTPYMLLCNSNGPVAHIHDVMESITWIAFTHNSISLTRDMFEADVVITNMTAEPFYAVMDGKEHTIPPKATNEEAILMSRL